MTRKLKELDIPSDILERAADPIGNEGETVLDFFLCLVSKGESPRMAEVLAAQQAPGIGITDAIFMQDQNRHGTHILERMNGNQQQVDALKNGLAKRGYKLKPGDHYIPTAARFASDPEAIVNNTNTFGDLKKKVESRGKETHGAVSVKHNAERHREKAVRLAPQIVNRIDEQMIKQNPDLASKPASYRRDAIIDKHGASKKDD